MSHLTVDPYTHTASGDILINEKFGPSNPTIFPIDATWAMTIDFNSANLVLSTTPADLPANGVAIRSSFLNHHYSVQQPSS